MAAWVERNLCADPDDLKLCILRSRCRNRQVRILRPIIAPSAGNVFPRHVEITQCCPVRWQFIGHHLIRRILDPSRKSGGALHRLHCFCLEFDGACEVQRRVPTDWIIEPIDVSGHGSFSLAS